MSVRMKCLQTPTRCKGPAIAPGLSEKSAPDSGATRRTQSPANLCLLLRSGIIVVDILPTLQFPGFSERSLALIQTIPSSRKFAFRNRARPRSAASAVTPDESTTRTAPSEICASAESFALAAQRGHQSTCTGIQFVTAASTQQAAL